METLSKPEFPMCSSAHQSSAILFSNSSFKHVIPSGSAREPNLRYTHEHALSFHPEPLLYYPHLLQFLNNVILITRIDLGYRIHVGYDVLIPRIDLELADTVHPIA